MTIARNLILITSTHSTPHQLPHRWMTLAHKPNNEHTLTLTRPQNKMFLILSAASSLTTLGSRNGKSGRNKENCSVEIGGNDMNRMWRIVEANSPFHSFLCFYLQLFEFTRLLALALFRSLCARLLISSSSLCLRLRYFRFYCMHKLKFSTAQRHQCLACDDESTRFKLDRRMWMQKFIYFFPFYDSIETQFTAEWTRK